MKRILLALLCIAGLQIEANAQYCPLPPAPAGYKWQVMRCSDGCCRPCLVSCVDPFAPPEFSRLTFQNGQWVGDRINSSAKPMQPQQLNQNPGAGGQWTPRKPESQELPKPPNEKNQPPAEPKRATPPAASPPDRVT